MPTPNPRLLLTLSDDLAPLVDGLARHRGKPRATVVADLLREAAPAIRELLRGLDAVEAHGASVGRALRGGVAPTVPDQPGLPLSRRPGRPRGRVRG